jgi:peroxiredoxin (alkyl hydroperoxide reductase subunit C)
MTETQTFSMPRINDPAPLFECNSTHGPLKLADFKGKWVVLFSHPADFTPVCTTEFVEFAKRSEEWAKRNVQLMGLSVDGLYSHIAWVRNIEQNFGVKVGFPVITDIDKKVASLYGMIHPQASETATVRTVFFIDPKQTIRALIYYPMNVGRNMDEVVRVLDALLTADANACACPANWQPGDPVIVPPPRTMKDAEARLNEGYETKDWYFATKKLGQKPAAGKTS